MGKKYPDHHVSENKSYSLKECEAYFKCRRIKEVTKYANTFLLGYFHLIQLYYMGKMPIFQDGFLSCSFD